MITSLPCLGEIESSQFSSFNIENLELNKFSYSWILPPNGGPTSNLTENNTPNNLPFWFKMPHVFSAYLFLSWGSIAQKKVCSRIKSNLWSSSKKFPTKYWSLGNNGCWDRNRSLASSDK